MSERDSEIEFDFFEEPERPSEESRSRLPLRRAPRGPRRPPPTMAPLIRLVIVVVAAIALVVLLVFVVDRCRGNGREEAYEDYMADVTTVAEDSQQVGRSFTELLNEAGIKFAQVQTGLRGLATREEQAVARAEDIDPPGALREENEQMIEALKLRASGLRGMADAFQRTASMDPPQAAPVLADQARRFVASDVIWDDLFKDPAAQELDRRNVTGVAVPDSNFLEDPNLASEGQLRPTFRRIKGATLPVDPNALRGNELISVTAVPENEQLVPGDELNLVTASTNLAFRIAVENSGEIQETEVTVTLTIQKTPEPIRRQAEINLINPGQTKTVRIPVGELVPVGGRTTMIVEVEPVPNEARTENNSAQYTVAFSL